MEDTPENREFVLEHAKKYCKCLRINFDDVIWFFDPKEFIWFSKAIEGVKRPVWNKYYGISWRAYGIIFINFNKHNNYESLKDTVAHELIHLVSSLEHGIIYDKVVKMVMAGKRVR